jgi:SAM-dependent methyltransferase
MITTERGNGMKLNLGCGSHVPEGWINVDYALGARMMKIPFFKSINRKIRLFDLDWNRNVYLHDLNRRFPWPDSSVDVVYSSHNMGYVDAKLFLSECFRVLRSGGIIRVVVPDLRHVVDEYLKGNIPADEFVASLNVITGNSRSCIKNRLSALIEFPQYCFYDSARLIEVIKKAGFAASLRQAFDSDIDDINTIELQGCTEHAVIVEGRKV